MFVIDPKIGIKSCHCGLSAILLKKDSLRVVDQTSWNDGQGLFSCYFVSQRLMSIPAKAGIQREKTGFRIKCGMTALIIYKSLENLKYG